MSQNVKEVAHSQSLQTIRNKHKHSTPKTTYPKTKTNPGTPETYFIYRENTKWRVAGWAKDRCHEEIVDARSSPFPKSPPHIADRIS